jgi:hypothetical protein
LVLQEVVPLVVHAYAGAAPLSCGPKTSEKVKWLISLVAANKAGISPPSIPNSAHCRNIRNFGPVARGWLSFNPFVNGVLGVLRHDSTLAAFRSSSSVGIHREDIAPTRLTSRSSAGSPLLTCLFAGFPCRERQPVPTHHISFAIATPRSAGFRRLLRPGAGLRPSDGGRTVSTAVIGLGQSAAHSYGLWRVDTPRT